MSHRCTVTGDMTERDMISDSLFHINETAKSHLRHKRSLWRHETSLSRQLLALVLTTKHTTMRRKHATKIKPKHKPKATGPSSPVTTLTE